MWAIFFSRILPPLLRVFTSLPPTYPSPMAPPLTHVIHSLITIPVTPALRSNWFGKASSPSTSSRSAKSSRANSPVQTPKSRSDSSSRSSSPLPPKDPKPGAIDRALSVLTAGCRPLSRSPSLLLSSSAHDPLLRAYELLDVSMSHYIPGDIDQVDPSIRTI